MRKVTYLACPYAHEDSRVMEYRVMQSDLCAAYLISNGWSVHSPISQNHRVDRVGLFPRTWEFWKEQDIPILLRCDVLHVLTLEGWNTSTGVTAEILSACESDIPVEYIDPNVLPAGPVLLAWPV